MSLPGGFVWVMVFSFLFTVFNEKGFCQMIDTAQAFVLGAVQGLTEYLPVSSSGHLVIAQSLFGLSEPALFFDIVLHMGTLAAVVWYYWNDIVRAVYDLVEGSRALANGQGWDSVNNRAPGFRLSFLIIVGTIPTGLIGVLFKDEFESMFGSASRAGLMLIVTGTFLFLTRYTSGEGRGISGVAWWEAVIIGIAQGLAITPGISRSGATISAALFMGIGRETAARFSFLLSIPSIVGAMILKFEPGGAGVPAASLALGFATSLVVGYACLVLLVAIVKKGRLPWFSYYCFAVGALAFFFLR